VNAAGSVLVVVPAGVTDPRRPSGGNTYDRRLCEELADRGWGVRVREVTRETLGATLAEVPDGAVVVVDGLVASPCPEVVVPASRRLRTVVLVHLPLGVDAGVVERDREAAVLRACAAVVTTSEWTRRWLIEAYRLDPEAVHVARPGVDAVLAPEVEPGSDAGASARLLCVGAVTPEKGQDVLVTALAGLADRAWECECVGPLDRAPGFVAGVERAIGAAGMVSRIRLTGPRTGPALAAAYASADLLVLPSRTETYGMVVTEALARGLPVLAFDVGGVSEALGTAADGTRPGLLVPAGDVDALGWALRRWLDDPVLRRWLRAAAARRRAGLTGWGHTADRVARVLEDVAA